MGRRLIAGSRLLALLALAAGSLTACGDDGEGDLAAFCAALTDRTQMKDVFAELDPDDVATALSTFRSVQQLQERLRSLAPDAPRADIDTVLSFVNDVIAGLEDADPQSSEPPAVYAELRPRFDEVEAASQRLDRYVESNC